MHARIGLHSNSAVPRLLAATLAAVLPACAGSQNSPPPSASSPAPETTSDPDPGRDWDSFATSFVDEFFAAHPAYAAVQGRHEFDGQLPDWSKAGIEAEVSRLEAARDEALGFAVEDLGDTQVLEQAIIVGRIDRDLFWMKTAKWPFRNPFFYFDWMLDNLDPNVYVTREYAPLEERARAYIRYAKAIPLATAQIRENLAVPMPRTWIDFGSAGFAGFADYYETDVAAAFSSLEDEGLKEELKEANREASKAMRALAEWLESQRETATEDFALGPELFEDMVRATEGLDVDLDALEAAGRADLERNLASLKAACQAYAPKKTVDQCIAKLQRDKPKGGAVNEARAQLQSLEKTLRERDLVSIPGPEVASVAEAPPYMRQNFAYIDIPGPYEEGLASTYYISPPDPSWSKKVRDAYVPASADLMFTSVHEVWPGHFVQFLHANRAESQVARVFVGYAFAEGWAHYSEEMMCEEALCQDRPDIRIGQLLNALLRNARFLSAIGLHARGMSVSESEKLFRTQGHQDAGNAKQQAARGTYDAAYLNYTLGKLMILKLRRDWEDEHRGEGKPPLKEFHDEFLSYGGPPIPVVRRMMLGPDPGPSL